MVPVTSWCLVRLRRRNRSPGWKMTPGDRTSCDTTTRSVPLMTKVPLSVIIGKSPMKTVCSLISPVAAFMKRARTKIGAEKVMSFSLHSSTENFGGGRRSSSSGSNSSSSWRVSVKSLIGLMSRKVSARPSCRNHSNDVPLDRDQVGEGQGFVEVRERVAVPDGVRAGNASP